MKDKCEEWHPLISRYCDGELSREEQRRIEEHLGTCAACRKVFEQFKSTVTIRQGVELSGRQRERMIGLISERIGAADHDTQPSWFDRWSISFATPLLAAAAIVLLVLWQNERMKVRHLQHDVVLRPAKAGILPASDVTLLKKLSAGYGGVIEWLGLHDGDVSVGLPAESMTGGVSVFGRDEYVHLAIDLAPEAGIGASPLSIRLLLKPGVEAAGVYKISEGRRAKLVCRTRQSSKTGACVDFQMTIFTHQAVGTAGQSSLAATLNLMPQITERGGAVSVGGVLYFVNVTMGDPVTVSPERLNL